MYGAAQEQETAGMPHSITPGRTGRVSVRVQSGEPGPRGGQTLWRQRTLRFHRQFRARSAPCASNDVYTKDDIDLIVAYLFPEDAWYVIPIEAIEGRRSLYFYPNGSQKGLAMYEKYREAWWLMKSDHKSDVAKN
jgi:hypothetical protein